MTEDTTMLSKLLMNIPVLRAPTTDGDKRTQKSFVFFLIAMID